MIRKIPNIRLSAAILYAGATPTKVIRVLTFLKCETISTDTYQRDYLLATIFSAYELNHTALISSLSNQHL